MFIPHRRHRVSAHNTATIAAAPEPTHRGLPRDGASPRLLAVATALPDHVVRQQDVRAFAAQLFSGGLLEADPRLLGVFDSTGIEKRHTPMPLEWFGRPHDLGESNALYVEHAVPLAERAIRSALEAAALTPRDVDHIVFVSSTGISTPSLDARLANRLGFRPDIRRTPLWGLGCAGGAAGLSRARDFALAAPASRVLLVALELCSLTFQHGDRTRRNLVASSLFGDGAAAALIAGPACPTAGPGGGAGRGAAIELVAAHSTLWPDTLDVMGWEVDGAGLHVVFSRDIPTIVREWARPALDAFLARHGLGIADLAHVVAHPGGPKVLAAYAGALGLDAQRFRHAYDVLRECGNMSSPTCLFVLERALAAGDFRPGDLGVLAALGPGFSSEVVLLRGAAA
jgi:alkylresorcinol/alkylpyrone synthase